MFSVGLFIFSATLDRGFLSASVKGTGGVFSSLTADESPNSWLSPLFSGRQSGVFLQSFGPKLFKIS
jgi:hypothetical protein